MAMLASKSPFAPPLGAPGATMASSSSIPAAAYQPTRRVAAVPTTGHSFASPTESEFSDVDGPDSVKTWDEDKVCEYLRSVKCGEYEKIFRKNHINGENLLEMDKDVLKEMGIDKVGDRVRLFLGIKKLRTKAYANQKKRNRVSWLRPWPHLLAAPLNRDSHCRTRLAGSTSSIPHRPGLHGPQTRQAAEPCRRPPPTSAIRTRSIWPPWPCFPITPGPAPDRPRLCPAPTSGGRDTRTRDTLARERWPRHLAGFLPRAKTVDWY